MTIKLITAKQARLRFCDEEYIQSMKDVNLAILEASQNSHKVVVNILSGYRKGDFCNAYHVMRSLQEVGFDVILVHDSENGSSELTIDWSRNLEQKYGE